MWLFESNRQKHFLYAIPIAFLFTFLCTFGVAAALEFKDKEHGGTFDWLDWLATILGGIVGQALQLFVVFVILKAL